MGGTSAFFLAYVTHIIVYTALLKDTRPSESRLVHAHTLCIWDTSEFSKINVCLQNQLFLFALTVCATYWQKKIKILFFEICRPLLHCLDSHWQWGLTVIARFICTCWAHNGNNRNLWVQSLHLVLSNTSVDCIAQQSIVLECLNEDQNANV